MRPDPSGQDTKWWQAQYWSVFGYVIAASVVVALVLLVFAGLYAWKVLFPPPVTVTIVIDEVTFTDPSPFTAEQLSNVVSVAKGEHSFVVDAADSADDQRLSKAEEYLRRTFEDVDIAAIKDKFAKIYDGTVVTFMVVDAREPEVTSGGHQPAPNNLSLEDDQHVRLHVKFDIQRGTKKGSAASLSKRPLEPRADPERLANMSDLKSRAEAILAEKLFNADESTAVFSLSNDGLCKPHLKIGSDIPDDIVLQLLYLKECSLLADQIALKAKAGLSPESLEAFEVRERANLASFLLLQKKGGEKLEAAAVDDYEHKGVWDDTQGGSYNEAYTRWIRLLYYNAVQNSSHWERDGEATKLLKTLNSESAKWTTASPHTKHRMDGSIVTLALFALVTLDCNGFWGDSAFHVNNAIGSNRYREADGQSAASGSVPAPHDSLLTDGLDKLCKYIENKLYMGEATISATTDDFPYSKGNRKKSLVGGKLLYFLAKAILERQRRGTALHESKHLEAARSLIVVLRGTAEPNAQEAWAPIQGCGHYEYCYLMRALTLLCRHEAQIGRYAVASEYLLWAEELLEVAGKKQESLRPGGPGGFGQDFSHFYRLLANTSFAREVYFMSKRDKALHQLVPLGGNSERE